MSRVLSIDPGTRNLSICCLRYDVAAEPELPPTMEQFLSRIELENIGYVDLGTNHIESAGFCFRSVISQGHDWHWVTTSYDPETTDVVIEQQGSRQSPIIYLCHTMQVGEGPHTPYHTSAISLTRPAGPRQGVFLGMQALLNKRGSITVSFAAAAKFRGDFVRVQARDGVRLEIAAPEQKAGDPVKMASVEACERLMSWFPRTPMLEQALARVRSEQRQHDLCDCVLQGIS